MSSYANATVDATPRPRIISRAGALYALKWIAWSLPALPVAVLVHEFGHLAWFKIFGFPGVKLHYAAVSHVRHEEFWQLARHGHMVEAARITPLYQIGIATATGILITYITIIGAAYLTTKRPPHPFIVAVGLTAALRFRIGTQVLERLLFTSDKMPSGTDEGVVSAVSGIPEALLWIIGFAIVIPGWFFIIRGLPKGRRLLHFLLVAVGVALGAVAYVGYIGPWLLPY
ncbi:MAG: hypothetical protein ABIT20_17065 [Gemmatimonadaceae bacterium]